MALEAFPVESRFIPETGGRHLQARIQCMKCGRVQWETVQAVGWAFKAFRAKGWLLGNSRARDTCPGCRNQKPKRPELTPAQRRAAYLRIEGIPRAAKDPEPVNPIMEAKLKPIREVMNAKPTTNTSGSTEKAESPRTPTPVENRRILDAMEEHYDADQGLYRGSFTDQALAQKLAVPRAWVTKVRNDFYGPEVNEATLQRGAQLDVVIEMAKVATEKLTSMAIEAEKIERDLKAARDKL